MQADKIVEVKISLDTGAGTASGGDSDAGDAYNLKVGRVGYCGEYHSVSGAKYMVCSGITPEEDVFGQFAFIEQFSWSSEGIPVIPTIIGQFAFLDQFSWS